MRGLEGYIVLATTIALTVYGQLVLKWQVGLAGPVPDEFRARLEYILDLLMRPFVISCFAAAFLAALAWIIALNRFNLSWAYPFMSLTFPLVVFASAIFFNEPLSTLKVVGVMLIMAGVTVQAMG